MALFDVTLHRGAEEHLAPIDGKDRELLEAAPVAIVVASRRGEIVLLNLMAEELFGYVHDELLGRQVERGFCCAAVRRAAAGHVVEPLGQAIQREHPKVRVVKTLNSVSAHLMVDPGNLKGQHSVFIASNDEAAKREVTILLQSFGWHDVIDLGDLAACRAMEQLIPLWMRLESKLGGPQFNLSVVRGQS